MNATTENINVQTELIRWSIRPKLIILHLKKLTINRTLFKIIMHKQSYYMYIHTNKHNYVNYCCTLVNVWSSNTLLYHWTISPAVHIIHKTGAWGNWLISYMYVKENIITKKHNSLKDEKQMDQLIRYLHAHQSDHIPKKSTGIQLWIL